MSSLTLWEIYLILSCLRIGIIKVVERISLAMVGSVAKHKAVKSKSFSFSFLT